MSTINPVWLIVLTTFVALMPVLLGIFTSYIKVSIVLSMLKSGFGAQQIPGQMVVMVLSLATTLYIMAPVISETGKAGMNVDYQALLKSPSVENFEKLTPLFTPWREFIFHHSGSRELAAVASLEKAAPVDKSSAKELDASVVSAPLLSARDGGKAADAPVRVLVLAYVLSELKEAFAMGFVLLLPFLVIDMVVANILAGLGMVMVSPLLISLPLKVILFILADGWLLLTRSLILSYQM